MTYPDKKQSMILLEQWKNMHTDLKALFDGLKPSLGCVAESPLFETTWKLFDAYTIALSAQLGDTTTEPWMQWYAFENGMGSKNYPAGYDGKLKPVKSLADLHRLIVIARART